ncbi:hypothetical protein PDJAM_G00160570 [Pangasius djambal]|uniref:Uncharacterized protein n=1 Tax=Pangasius djambal TaxID=1691987 RepID=A0ACC5ZKD5_9TELE|nr:hypothetical protein [Pangasius djambal]
MDSRYIMMAALGRPLYPGMLYDCRSDSVIPGVTLWDKKSLNDDLDVHQQPNTHLNFPASDTLSDKAKLLDISTSLKASFLGGLVEVGGSAKYLHDNKSSARQCRVTMQYSQTTKFEQLIMKELGSITYPQVFGQITATHVVTAVLYGAQAFMVFDYTTAKNESKQAIERNLHAVVKKIPTIAIEGEASLKMNEEEKKMADDISVTFYGDYELEQNPTTYKEALEVYKTLPTLLKQGNNGGVPMTVWLYPLTFMDNRADKLAREINLSLVGQTEKLLEDLGEVERIFNDLTKNQTTDNFPDVKGRLLQFQDLHRSYKIAFQKALSRVLPAIRGGTEEDKALEDILDIHYKSPFTGSNMKNWLDDITAEINILSSYTSGLKDLTVVKSSGSLHSILFDPDVDVVVCLSFTSLRNEDSYLVALEDFMSSEGFANLGQKHAKAFSLQATQPWFTSPDISECMKQNVSLFTRFSKANKNEKKIKFIIASISDSSNPGTSIRVYQKSILTDPKFQPLSKPPKPMVETSGAKVTLKLSKSPTGETVRFRVEYRMTQPTESAADAEAWKVVDTSDAQTSFTLTGLKPAGQYWFRYRAVSDVGVSEASDSVPFSFHGMLNVTAGQWDFSMPPLFNKLRTKIMTSMGMSRWSLSTIKSEVTNIVNSHSIPYDYTIPGGLRAGMALYFQGVVSATGQSPMISKWICCDSLRNGKWEKQENTSVCPISKGSVYDIFIVTKTEGYEVYVNGQSSCLFKHRMPVENLTALHIHGDVIMNTVGIVANWSTSTFAKELNSGISRTKCSNIQSDVPHPVCNPCKPYFGSIPGGLRPGVALFFQGVVPSDCERFEINLQTGPKYLHDIALHFNPRMYSYSVALNSCRNGRWEHHIETPGGPFIKGGAFDIIMVIKPEGYEVIVNGLLYCTFAHRIPVDKVTTVDIRGDVFMNKFSIIEVDDINLNVTNPANI